MSDKLKSLGICLLAFACASALWAVLPGGDNGQPQVQRGGQVAAGPCGAIPPT